MRTDDTDGAAATPLRAGTTTLARRLRGPLIAFAILALILRGTRTPVICPFRIILGRPCPLCGTTRAVGYLLHGDLRAARQSNRITSVLFFPVAIAVVTLGRRSGRPLVNPAPRT